MSKNNGDACVVFEVIMKPQDHEYLAGYDKRKSLEHAIEACNAYEGLKKERGSLLVWAKEVMDALEKFGPSIVPHLIDTDDNAGERLRQAIALCEGGAE